MEYIIIATTIIIKVPGSTIMEYIIIATTIIIKDLNQFIVTILYLIQNI